ncbi:hypothetical protein QBC43DRAFT_237412 [Cladorrhinum sp. PSN259]|nr:hypothetical protein QBC43DRAFT_237412 [Cladorrhinum sp. PSN259]
MGRLDLTFLGLALPAIAAATFGSLNPGNICETLSTNLPGLVAFPNTTLYDQEVSGYWSKRQAELRPSCLVTPRSAQDVSKAVKVLTSRNAKFTVKAGGHTGYPSSNIEDGVTIDLVFMNEIKVFADRKTVTVGPGNRWVNLAEALDPLGLAVVGGRASTVGVSGLLLGGGISYFTGIYGWACDNVKLFEVVTSSGDIIQATATKNKDLFWALRGGGGSNFGIVTRFDLLTFEQGELWASSLILPGALNTTLIPALQNYAVNTIKSDPSAHQYYVMMYYPAYGGFIILSDQFHPSAKSLPDVFKPLHQVPAAAVLSNHTRLSNVTQLTRDIENANVARQNFAVTSVKATSAQLILDYVKIWEEQVLRVVSAVNGKRVQPLLVVQIVPENVLELMQQNGGNALGIKPSDGPLFLVQSNWEWDDASLDGLIEAESKKLIDEYDRIAKQRGLWKGYVYMNYASRWQDVYKSYGVLNEARLKLIALKYDPLGRFRSLWKGYFKL